MKRKPQNPQSQQIFNWTRRSLICPFFSQPEDSGVTWKLAGIFMVDNHTIGKIAKTKASQEMSTIHQSKW